MAHQGKQAWTMLVVSTVVYAVYVAVILNRAGGHELAATPYAAALLWTAGAGVVATMVTGMSLGMANPRGSRLKDAGDREIGRVGDYTGQSFVIIGATAAMLMAMAGWDRFWMANVIYLCFILSAIPGSVTKIVSYRTSFPW